MKRLVRADQGETMAAGRELRKQFSAAHAGRARGNGGKRTAKLSCSVRLWIKRVEMAGRAPEPKEKDRLGRAPALRCQVVRVCQSQAKRRGCSGAQVGPSADSLTMAGG